MFVKGQSGNPAGRKPGSKNAIASAEIRERIKNAIDIEGILSDLDDCKPEQRAALKIKLLEFAVPKLRSIEIFETTSLEELLMMTPEQRRERIAELKNQINDKR